MAAEEQSGFVRAARKRWSQAHIEGDGSFALVSYCCEGKHVRLFWFYPEASPLVSQRCPHAFCKMEHKLYRIQALEAVQRPQAQFQAAHSCGYGRD